MSTTDNKLQRDHTQAPTVEARREYGRSLRKTVPRSSHGEWSPAEDRFDPVALIEEQDDGRLQFLVPVRHGRMSESSFAFFRGAAQFMAADLASTPVSGLNAQLCGDAHLSNFGVFGSPERTLVFDVNDFDESLAGPWEWDVKRLAASFMIAARHREFDEKTCRRIARRAVRHYREAMAEFAAKPTLDVWYAHLPIEEVFAATQTKISRRQRERRGKLIRKAKSKDSLRALSKLAEEVDGRYRIKSDPPLLVPFRDLPPDAFPASLSSFRDALLHMFEEYRSTLPEDRRVLFDRYRPIDVALKVVGVGSVGTRCFVMLLEGRDQDDPLFLQIKEAGPSVLEEFLAPSPYEHHGQRVVEGQLLMQAASDIFLGWTESRFTGHHYYIRQMHDMKGSVDIGDYEPQGLLNYTRFCGWTLARAHARSGDAIAIAAYLGNGRAFDDALTSFAELYAEQNERDYDAFTAAIRNGRLAADYES